MFDFNGDGKVDLGEEFIGYQIYQDVNSDSGVFSGGRSGGSLADGVVNFLVYAIFLVPFFLFIALLAWLAKQESVASSVAMLLIVLALLAWVIWVNVKERRRKAKANELEDMAWDMVKDDVYTDEEIRDHAKSWLAMHPGKGLAYKKDPEAFRDEIEMDLRRVRQTGVWYKLMKKEGVQFM